MTQKEKKPTYSMFSNYWFIYKSLWKFDKKVIFFSLAEVLFCVATAFGALLMPSLIIGMLEEGLPLKQMLIQILLIFIGYGSICALSTYLTKRNSMQYVAFRIIDMMPRQKRKNMRMDFALYESKEIQKLSAKADEAFWGNSWGLEGILHNDVKLLAALFGLLLYSLVISGANPWIVVLLLAVSIIQLLAFNAASRYEMKHKDQEAEFRVTQRYLDRQAYETSVGKDVRLYQLQDWLSGLYRRVNKSHRRLLARIQAHYFATDLLGLFLQLARDGICYGYMIYLLTNGMNVSSFVLYMGIISGYSGYFSQFFEYLSQNSRFHKMVSFFREYMDIPQIFHHGDGEILDADASTLEVDFSHVSFSYPGSDKKILDDISFTMKPGEKIALVGINGAGKSTLIKLICGFYQPTSGKITVNGKDLRDLDMDEYIKELAVVFQESFTTSFSIAENVACCTEQEFDREKCIRSLKKSGLWEKISALPKGENTCLNKDVEDDGILLSGGETQKLLLARALYKGGRMLLLDEPTAALDAIAETEMYEKYQELTAGKTSLFISHRLASTRFCDRILFLENGKITEQGTHEELLTKNGSYAEMFRVQSQYYTEGDSHDEY
ncbi:MAG: ABC transporter ATP-binding protein [Clostridiales bacterium]|nr:ABC transporter ATP-binding protein [Clostridiales bacterium]